MSLVVSLCSRGRWTRARAPGSPSNGTLRERTVAHAEDPSIPELRHVLTHSREKLIDLHKETERYSGPFELVEPDEEELSWVREIMERQPP